MDSFDWIKEYELKPYHEVKTESLKCYFLYCNEKKELVSVKTDIYKLETANKISKDELIKIINTHRKNNSNNQYIIKDILGFIVNLRFEDVNDYISGKKYESMLKNIDLKDQILFPSIEMFQYLNSLFFVYVSKKLKSNNTKKVYIHATSRKTKKKRA